MAVVNRRYFPFAMMVERLITDVYSSGKSKEEAEREYINEAINISNEERERCVRAYLQKCLLELYGSGEEGMKARRADFARISLGGKVPNVELKPRELQSVVGLLLEVYREGYGDIPFAEFKG